MPDTFFDEAMARSIVKDALHSIADFRGDNIDHFNFRRFTSFHRSVFVASLKAGVKAIIRDEQRYYDILMDDDTIDSWPTIGDCIQWVLAHKGIRIGGTARLKREDMEDESP